LQVCTSSTKEIFQRIRFLTRKNKIDFENGDRNCAFFEDDEKCTARNKAIEGDLKMWIRYENKLINLDNVKQIFIEDCGIDILFIEEEVPHTIYKATEPEFYEYVKEYFLNRFDSYVIKS